MARFSADGQDYTYALALGTQANLTVCGWFKLAVDRNDYSTIFSIDNGTGDNWLMQTGVDGTTMNTVFDATTQQSMGAMSVGTWYFICLSTAGTSGSIHYRTAASPSLTTVAVTGVTASVNAATLRIGESPWGAEWWNGCGNAVKVYTAALTAADALQESMQYVPVRTANLVAFYPLVRPEATDYSGNARTLSGGAGATREDGPPIPWLGVAPRIVVPATSSGTTVAAEVATATAAAADVVTAVGASSVEAAGTAAAQTAAAVTAVIAAATGATAAAAAIDASTAVQATVATAASSAAGVDAVAAVAISASEAAGAAAANDATVVTGAATTAAAETATAAAAAVTATPVVTTQAVDAGAVGAAHDPAVSVVAASTAATGTAAGLDPAAAVSSMAGDAAANAAAANATVATSGGANVSGDTAAAVGAALDATVRIVTNPDTAAGAAAADGAAGVTVVLAQPQTAAATTTVHDPGVSIVVSIGTAEAAAVTWDVEIPAQVSRGGSALLERAAPASTVATRTAASAGLLNRQAPSARGGT